jgi:hypothetical protein
MLYVPVTLATAPEKREAGAMIGLLRAWMIV